MRGVVIANLKGRLGRVQALGQHQPSGLLKTQSFLKLKGTHSRDRLEVGMESRNAHANLSRDLFHAQWLGEILTQFLAGSDYAMSVSSNRGEMAHAMTLLAEKQAIDNFPNNQRTKYPILLGHLK